MEFPKNWPSGCPPADAVDGDGNVFRIVKNDPPQAVDFASHMETGRLRNAPACLRCGLSVFRELGDAVHQRSLMPKLGRWIAMAALQPNHGKTKMTSGGEPTHTTWWPYQSLEREALFAVVTEAV